MSMVKRVYHIAAVFAFIHLAAIGGLVGWLASDGMLDSEKVDQIATILRGPEEEAAGVEAKEDDAAAPAKKSSDSLDQDQTREELFRLQMDRRMAELSQQASTITAARLQVTRQREALKRREEEVANQQNKRQKQEQTKGFKKELEILSSLKPKVALFQLSQKTTPDAAKLLLTMNTRNAKRIVEAAKSPAEKRRMADLLKAMRDISPEEAQQLENQLK